NIGPYCMIEQCAKLAALKDHRANSKHSMKVKTKYVCSQCAAIFSQWAGHCTQCGAWNSVTEEGVVASNHSARMGNYANQRSTVTDAEAVVLLDNDVRMDAGLAEFNRVLGGGLVEGSVVLIGGDPGIGKSTLLLQTIAH